MKRLVALCLCISQISWGAVAFVGTNTQPNAGKWTSTTVKRVTYTSTAGNAIVVTISVRPDDSTGHVSVSGIVDSGGSTYTLQQSSGTTCCRTEIWTATNVQASTTFDITFSASGSTAAVNLGEYSGVNSIGNKGNSAGASASTTYTGNATTQDMNNFIVASVLVGGVETGGYTATNGTIRQSSSTWSTDAVGHLSNLIHDNTAASPGSVTASATYSVAHSYAMAIAELRSIIACVAPFCGILGKDGI